MASFEEIWDRILKTVTKIELKTPSHFELFYCILLEFVLHFPNSIPSWFPFLLDDKVDFCMLWTFSLSQSWHIKWFRCNHHWEKSFKTLLIWNSLSIKILILLCLDIFAKFSNFHFCPFKLTNLKNGPI